MVRFPFTLVYPKPPATPASPSSLETPLPEALPHGQRRRAGGARREASERVVIRRGEVEHHGWTLNVSRGGIRAVMEDALLPDVEYLIFVGDEPARRAQVAWMRNEADGQIVGIRFLDVDGSVPPDAASEPPAPR
jgi:hypothetical protein